MISAAYYFLPNIKQKIRLVVPGAAIATILLMLDAKLLTLYISQFNQVNLIYGSRWKAADIIAALLFFYFTNIIFKYAAELKHLAKLALGEKPERRR